MKILAIDTSSDTATVGLVVGGRPIVELSASARTRHGQTLVPYVDRVLGLGQVGPPDLDLLAVGLGPGSFTGLRVGLATAKGLAVACGTPLCGVTSLAGLARGVGFGWAVPIVDAQRGEVFASVYRLEPGGPSEERLAPFHASPEEAATRIAAALEEVGEEGPASLFGSGLRRYRDVLGGERLPGVRVLPPAYDVPRATWIAVEAQSAFERTGPSDLDTLEPIYVRSSDAKLPDKPLRTPD